ncbi:hypothetical protein CVV38_04010 [Candidatus Peregrinibacteria bacterium HGW-Peregrinibacteria-1]|jgi:hypothetical protein|nr:MAG: hypothetical protein CVV38_04010 [Candidatus Peregrinibacteria bacterium HGW-Peregrinibacteria-1]
MTDLKNALIAECNILIRRLEYLEKTSTQTIPAFLGNVAKELTKYRNDNARRDILIKSYFTRLLLNLVHLFAKDEKSADIAEKFEITPQQMRFKRRKVVTINNLKELVLFFRDAICHPEEKPGEYSPRRSVKYNVLDDHGFMTSFYDKTSKDTCFMMGDCKMRLSQIKIFLKQV